MTQRQLLTQRLMLAALFLVTLGAFGVATVSEFSRQAQARCQAHYNDVNNQRTRLLTGVAEDERVAERAASDALGATFLDPSLQKPADQRTAADRARVQKLFAAYLAAERVKRAARAEADRARAANPVPPPPSEVCG